MLWEIKKSETVVGWPNGGDIIEAIKPMMCGWFRGFFLILILISIILKCIVSVGRTAEARY